MADKVADAMNSMVKNLEKKTGKSLDQWKAIARKSGFARHGEIIKFLKTEHELGHGYANMVAHSLLNPDVMKQTETASDDLLAAQYAGAKANLKPFYDKLIKAVSAFGSDVEVSAKKTYVSLRRSKQFAIVQPSTATRLDVGINLKSEPATKRLEASGSFNAMVSHRVRVESIDQIDKELLGWLKKAYDAA